MPWRPMAPADLDRVLDIAAIVHPDNPESRESFASRLERFPQGCMMLQAESGAVGYGFAHPAMLRRPPPLDCVLGPLPDAPDCLHLHDIAILTSHRGGGDSARYLDRLRKVARDAGIATLALVSVNGSVPFWSRHGFTPLDGQGDDPHLARALASYCGGGTYMIAAVD